MSSSSMKASGSFLTRLYPESFVRSALVSQAQYHPYPTASERDAWQSLPEAVRKAHIEQGEQAKAEAWPHLPATLYLQYAQNGNRRNFELPHFARRHILCQMVTAECMEGQGRFVEAIADAVWSICEESSWCLPAHIGAQKYGSGLPDVNEPIVDLFAAETSSLLAWTLYLVGPQLKAVSPLIPARIRQEIDERILTPALARDDFWWMGFGARKVNNWNPWINSNWLTSMLIVEEDQDRRVAAMNKILASLDKFITPYPEDGGCDEGPSYWGRAGASLYDCLELLYGATGGKLNVYGEPLVQNIGRFVYRAHIDGGYYVNFADAPARVSPDPILVYGYGKRIGDEHMMRFGAWLAQENNLFTRGTDIAASMGRVLPALFTIKEVLDVSPEPPLLRDVWLDQIQVFAARDQGGASQGMYVAAKGGHNDESHNHNDIGHFLVYVDGKPLIIDAGVETYTRKTFSPQRYEIWTMQSAYHSLPTIDGVMQLPGEQYRATDVHYTADDQCAAFSLDISKAYPPEARLDAWKRTVTLERGRQVQVTDAFTLNAPVQEITFSLITPCKVAVSDGSLALGEAPLVHDRMTASGRVAYDSARLTVSTEEIPINDERMGLAWGSSLTRILFHLREPALSDTVSLAITR